MYHELTDVPAFWGVENDDSLRINWTHKETIDYQQLGEDYYISAVKVLDNIFESGHDNVKSDMWFLPAVYMMRQAIELLIKSLIAKEYPRKCLQNIFIEDKHNLIALWRRCKGVSKNLNNSEREWIEKYFTSLEYVDKNSDLFRFPFEDDFLKQYRNSFLENADIANNLDQAYSIVYKALTGKDMFEYEFDAEYEPSFLVFSSHGIGNCSLWRSLSSDGFHEIVEGYLAVTDYLYYDCDDISPNRKFMPVMFLVRNSIELSLKRFFTVELINGIKGKGQGKKRSHYLKSDLWKTTRPMLIYNAKEHGEDVKTLLLVDKAIDELDSIDKNGCIFRYPTTFSLEYKFDKKIVDFKKMYGYFKGLACFLDGCNWMLKDISDYEANAFVYEN